MEVIESFEYEGQSIEFDLSKRDIMINATEMAKIYGKRVDHFLKTEPTKAFIQALKFPPTGVNLAFKSDEEIIQTKGRNGTWMHRVLALKFAAWLDPAFEVWIYFTIDRILFGDIRNERENKAKRAERRKELSEVLVKTPEYLELLRLDYEDKLSNRKIKNQFNRQLELVL